MARLRAEGLTDRDAALAVDFVADLTIGTELAMRGWLDGKLTLLLNGVASRLGEPTTAVRQTPVPAPEDTVPDRETIVAAGRALARRDGLAAVTVHTVAGELGSTTTALRREIGDRDGLVVAMLDAVAREIVVPLPQPGPRAELVALALAVHGAIQAGPWAVPAWPSTDSPDRRSCRYWTASRGLHRRRRTHSRRRDRESSGLGTHLRRGTRHPRRGRHRPRTGLQPRPRPTGHRDRHRRTPHQLT